LLVVLFMLNESYDIIQTIGTGETKTIARLDCGNWRYMISSTELVRVIVEQNSNLFSLPPKIEYIAPNSAIELQGKGAVTIKVDNFGSPAATVKGSKFDYLCGGLEYVEYAESQRTTPAGGLFHDMGMFGGYPAPYMNRCRLYVDLAQLSRIQAFDWNGDIVFQSGVQPIDEVIYIDLNTPQGYRWEIRESDTGGTGLNYTVIWFRK
jgi:hypothetical protein